MLLPDSDIPTTEEMAPISTDAMARILEPRVRSNAKNNAKPAKTVVPKPSPTPKIAPETVPQAVAEIASEIRPASPPVAPPASPPVATSGAAVANEIVKNLAEMREMMMGLQENQLSRDRAFDLLYDELDGYKNDFYFERLKPTLRSLLFLLDSIEGFDHEIDDYTARDIEVTKDLVKANLQHFRDQLTDVLTLSEMTPVVPGGDKFDPKTQRAVEVVKVGAAQNNTVQRQIRSGWRLSGRMLRPADVVVGRSEGE